MNIDKLIEDVTRETQPDRFGDKSLTISRDDTVKKFDNSNYSHETVELVARLHSLLDLRIPKDFDFTICIDDGQLDIELVHCSNGCGEEVEFPVAYDDNMNNTLAVVNWQELRVFS